MAWYLNDVVTDLSPVREILGLYHHTGAFTEAAFHDEYRARLILLLRDIPFNSDHIDIETIPTEHENDQYQWFAAGYHDLVDQLGLIKMHRAEQSDDHSFELTELGIQVVNQTLSIPDLMSLKLPEWRNDQRLYPYQAILDTASRIKQRQLYPCGGLMLLEVFIILRMLNEPYARLHNPYDRIYRYREAFYAHMSGELPVDLVEYSGYLWEQLSEEPPNFHTANYPARSSLQLMMYAGDLHYGPVPEEVFGIVQYVTTA